MTQVSLSESALWDIQWEYFNSKSIEAWRNNVVPSYVTSNSYIAYTYMQMVRAFIADRRRAAPDNVSPVYIIELGAGSGRFAYHFLQHLWRNSAVQADWPPICYVMTDISQNNVDYWRQNEQLQPFVDSGQLDFAQFNPVHEDRLFLQARREMLSATDNGMAVIANYFFDVIENDVFQIRGGKLAAGYVKHLDTTDFSIDFDFVPCEADYYHDDDWNSILATYETAFTTTTTLLFPVGGLRCLQHLNRLGGDNWVLISADKGQNTLASLEGQKRQFFVQHGGCFSLSVNYHALASYGTALGMDVRQPAYPANSININTFLKATEHAAFDEAYLQHLTTFSPDDFFMLKKVTDAGIWRMTFPQIIAMMRLSHWDHKILLTCFRQLQRLCDDLSNDERAILIDALDNTCAQYYNFEEDNNFYKRIALLYQEADAVDKARAIRETAV